MVTRNSLIRCLGGTLCLILGMANTAAWADDAPPILSILTRQCEFGMAPQPRETACSSALERHPASRQTALLYYFRALARQDLNKVDMAATDLSSAIEQNPALWPARWLRAKDRLIHRQYAEALSDWDGIIAAKPDLPGSYSERAVILTRMRRLDEAVAGYDKAIALAGERDSQGLLFAERGVANESRHDYAAAQQDAEKTLRLTPTNNEALMTHGRSAYLSGNMGRASVDFTKALAAAPNDVYASLWLYLAEAHSAEMMAVTKLRERNQAQNLTPWPGPIARVLAGEIPSEQAKPQAFPPLWPEAAQQAAALCELAFYTAEQALIQGQKSKAKALFQATIATDVTDYLEYNAAQFELSRLSP